MKSTLQGSFFFLFLIAVCYLFVHYLYLDNGYVLIAFNGYRLETSLWSCVLALFLAVSLIRLTLGCMRLVSCALGFPVASAERVYRRRAQQLSSRGLAAFANGDWKQAQKLLSQAGRSSSLPLHSYLAAARASAAVNDMASCKNYLSRAEQAMPTAHMAIGITQAEIQMARNEFEQALATLKSLRAKAPKHVYVLKLLKQVYEHLADWRALAGILPDLIKYRALDTSDMKELEPTVYSALLTQACCASLKLPRGPQRTESINRIWKGLSRAQRKNRDLIWSYANCLCHLGTPEEAETFIRKSLSASYSARMARLYSGLVCDSTERQIAVLEKLRQRYPKDASLLLGLGSLYSRSQRSDKAVEYTEAGFKLRPDADACQQLGILLSEAGEYRKATEYFHQALKLRDSHRQKIKLEGVRGGRCCGGERKQVDVG
ncbi:MAG: hypothetical protein OXC07_07700 [Kistimonas sp.]|nr:hypothetical protein [Kistimonas sp.]